MGVAKDLAGAVTDARDGRTLPRIGESILRSRMPRDSPSGNIDSLLGM